MYLFYLKILNFKFFKEGFGIWYFKNGDIYAGEWKNNKKHGRGFFFTTEGDRYEVYNLK